MRRLLKTSCFFPGYGVTGEAGNYRVSNGTGAEANSSANGLNNYMNFSSSAPSRSRFMPSIPENGNEGTSLTNLENGQWRNGNSANSKEYDAAFPKDTWNDSSFNRLKRNRDGDSKMFSNFGGSENQVGCCFFCTSILVLFPYTTYIANVIFNSECGN